MALVVQQLTTAAPAQGVSYLVQDIVNRVSSDTRYQMGLDAASIAILVDYTNRVHLELLRTSRWRFLESPVIQFTTQIGKTDYYIGAGTQPAGSVATGLLLPDINQIRKGEVFDRTNFAPLFPTLAAPLLESLTQNAKPKLWRRDDATPDVMNLYPPPDGAYTIEFRYHRNPVTLTQVTDPIQVPDKYVDVLVAGVNELAFVFLKRPDEVQYWAQRYVQGKTNIIRDTNLHPGGADFISPDPMTQATWYNNNDPFWNNVAK